MITPTEPSRIPDAKVQAVDASELPLAPPAEGGKPQRFLRLLVSLILLGIAVFAFYYFIILPGHHEHFFTANRVAPAEKKKKPLDVALVEGTNDTLVVPSQVREALGIRGVAVAKIPTHGRPLVMPGSTALDPTRIMRVRTRFNAQVTEVGKAYEAVDPAANGYRRELDRELRAGDKVRKGDVLAVVWSIDVGGKKSDLVDALVQLRLDEQRLKARKSLYRDGNIPEDTLNQTLRDVITGTSACSISSRTNSGDV